MSRRRKWGLSALVACAACGLAAPSASATFDLMKIRQIHPDNQGMFDSGDWVELQMFADGQNLVAGAFIRSYDPDGTLFKSFQFPANANTVVANGQSQRTILVSNTSSVGGTTPDFNAPLSGNGELQLRGEDGAVCYEAPPPNSVRLDCVSYGAFTGVGFPTGTPAVATPFGSTLERTIAPNCPTLLEGADDTDNSATDFALSTTPPRNNAATPTETPCAGTGGGTDTQDPQTKIRKIKVNSERAKVTIRFKGTDESQGTIKFQCKLDKKKFKKCRSPKTFKHLSAGRHKVKVRAIDAAGNVDPTPAKRRFRIVPPGQGV
jgi:hypothetical protein